MALKQELRRYATMHLPELCVLDCFAGYGNMWRGIEKKLYITMDERRKCKPDLLGDNVKYLHKLNLAEYNIIDLDAYGIPDKQLKAIFENKTIVPGTVVFFTFIQLKNSFGAIPHLILIDLGYTKTMLQKIPTLFKKNGFEKFCNWLAIHGVKKLFYLQKKDKVYGYFIV